MPSLATPCHAGHASPRVDEDGDGEARTLSEPPERVLERVAGTQRLVALLRNGCRERVRKAPGA
jgi:hypothetical protein